MLSKWTIYVLFESRRDRTDPNWVSFHLDGVIAVEEDHGDSVARVELELSAPSLYIRHLSNTPPILWCSQRKCADGAVLAESDGGLVLHVVELKSKLTLKEWRKVRQQFEGMIFNAISLSAVVEVARPSNVICYISFNSNAIDGDASANPALAKFAIGDRSAFSDLVEWKKGSIDIAGFTGIKLLKLQRDASTNSARAAL